MAKNTSLVWLGYDDEQITDKQIPFVDFTTNKIGGKPNWPCSEISTPPCPLCGLIRPLVLQIYAPLENSQFHRTFYIFACMNSQCSNQSKGWLCIRTEHLEKILSDRNGALNKKKNQASSINITSWCNGADDWGDEFGDDDTFDKNNISSNQMQLVAQQPPLDDNLNEQNGNTVCNNMVLAKNENRNMSDDEDESNSMDDPIPMFNNLQVIDDKNANCGEQQGGAMGLLNSPSASAEIEGEESEMVCVDAPVAPERDLIAMLKQTKAIPHDINNLILKSHFIAVDEEKKSSIDPNSTLTNDHILELLHKYQGEEEKQKANPSSPCNLVTGGIVSMKSDNDEKYEKTMPVHGDLMFHNYLERIQENPGQILRYSRDTLPLLISPLVEALPKCQYCGTELLCEIQILPTLISKLQFVTGEPSPIEFGNVLVFTCTKSCWDTPDKMRLEHVIVQKEI
ncbi:programmed cell death protein 2-like [Sitodiplosis mosellana]|uniref:programmed cell death protein 2-like n=1 Tax=Sitodiplosis mosellana TaxID=263140 RepID=UPI002444CD15|nr:programmed cell death protein 2-like [Sitodiplosis mosellana]